MKKSLYLLLGLLLVCSIYPACAPEELPGSIYGTVVDKATGEPIKSAGVELSPSGLKTVTGSEGQFQFDDIAQGSYTLWITKTGYSNYPSSTITVQPSQTTKVDVQIEKLPPALKVVNDNREEISTLDFGDSGADVARSFSLFNDGTELLEWQITVTAKWIQSVSMKEGKIPAGRTQSLVIIIDRTLLERGENTTTVHITSNNGTKQLTITAMGMQNATLNTLAATNIKTTSAVLNGEILTDGNPKYSERGFVYSESSMPTINDCIRKVTSPVTDTKLFSSIVTGLTTGKTYYVRAYAINAGEETYSTNEISFVPNYNAPKVTTTSVTIIDKTSAYLIGNVTDMGDPEYTERGFVYSTIQFPTLDADDVNSVVVAKTASTQFEKQVTIENLDSKVIYVRAYAKNDIGIAYGEVLKTDPKDAEIAIYKALPTFMHDGTTYRVHPDLGSTMTWQQAMDACNNLSYGGYSDWVLPSKNVLNTMYIHKNEIGGFSNTYYWSSTEDNYNSNQAWYQHFDYGGQDYYYKSLTYRVRCVRREN